MNNKKYIIANWKMKLGHKQSVRLASDLADRYKEREDLEVVLCPSFTSLDAVGEIIEGSGLKLGGQNCFYHDSGSYTGEVSPAVLKEMGVEYVIMGHSERRRLGETNDDINRKVLATLKNGLTPVVCVGETFEEYREHKTDVVIIEQVTKALEDVKLKAGQRLVLAYEPVWVIGTGQAVDHDVVTHIAQIIIHTAIDMDESIVDKFDVIYGGSVDATNVNNFIVGNISKGIIVGNMSLSAEDFLGIINNVK